MVTPTLMEPERPGGRPPDTVGEGRAPALLLYLIRLLASLLIPVFTVVVLVVSFNYLRNQNANRLLQVFIAIVVGVVGVWVALLGNGPIRGGPSGAVPCRHSPVHLRGAGGRHPDRVPGVPGGQHGDHLVHEPQQQRVRRASELHRRIHDSRHAGFDPQQHIVGRDRSRHCCRHRSRFRHLRGQAGAAVRVGLEVADLSPDGGVVCRRQRRVGLRVQLPP